jgi:hypothetical protein
VPLELIASAEATVVSLRRTACRLGIQYRSGGVFGTPLTLTPLSLQAFEPVLLTSAPKRPIDVLPRRNVLRQHAPGRSGTHHVTAGILQQAPSVARRLTTPPSLSTNPQPAPIRGRSDILDRSALTQGVGRRLYTRCLAKTGGTVSHSCDWHDHTHAVLLFVFSFTRAESRRTSPVTLSSVLPGNRIRNGSAVHCRQQPGHGPLGKAIATQDSSRAVA